MALTKPILYSISAFDATQEQTFIFNVVGGDQVVKNELIITDQSNNSVVYDQIQTTFSFKHVLPANTLTNGEYYSAVVITYNANNDSSAPSSGIQFYCFSEPSFNFTNIPAGNVIYNATYSFEITYDQNEGEMLNNYTFNLYDYQRNLLTTSGMLNVGGAAILPLIVRYTFTGLSDDSSYYIQATGKTINGMSLDTGLILISIQYTTPNVFSIMELNSNCDGGYITIQSNLTSIDGESIPDPPDYVDGNTAVNVTGIGDYVLWNNGFNIADDFTASLWGRDFNDNSTIITMSDGNQTMTIRYYADEDGLYYAELIVKGGYLSYYIYSNPIIINAGDPIQIWFRRIGCLYEIGLYNLV